ncbi:tubulin-specific chaperone D [Agrilus planipennis]|uniref:Tubulin-specific chaperone D n=1 Tax=Agrilus planipennis TaxID=224129 RepID=A0A1W4WQ67_AGRPL|nr:tubulin-specific chaperone D [Agrilus planipennis]
MSTDVEKSDENQKDEEPFGLGCALELFSESVEVMNMIDSIKSVVSAPISVFERAYERFVYILTQYQEQPHLLDSHLEVLLEKCIALIRDQSNPPELKHAVFKYMHVIISVRGYKDVVKRLPHEVADFEPVLQMLEQQDPSDSDTWFTRYVLLLWLSIIVMIPFHMSRLDGFTNSNDNKKTVMQRVFEVCKVYIVVPDKCRDAAAYLSARFLTRSDTKEHYLKSYFNWTYEISTNPESSVFVKSGCLASIAMILKYGKREDLVAHVGNLLQWIISANFKNDPGTNIQKLVYKNIQRIGLTFLPVRIASWRYQRGNRSLASNLSAGDGEKDFLSPSSPTDSNEQEENIEVPDEVEEVIDQLIHGLACNNSVVRWSAAKGIGRVTGRLPKDLADEVVGTILESFNPREGDAAWHGGCLALAELGRRGLLLPVRLPEVIPVIQKALFYDEPRGYSSVGSHVRDAACYLCWSFARAYDTSVLKPFVNQIASALLVATCFDREINCRRAAAAAFQENVGRQGTFPHGIDIVTVADFYAVSIRSNAYLNISVYIAQFNEYTMTLITHLIDRKVDHWDIAVRELTAKAFHNLTPSAPEYMAKKVLPSLFEKATSIDLNSRHGAILAIGEILLALSRLSEDKGVKMEDLVTVETFKQVECLIRNFQERLYFRGMGGELMRQACSNLIEKCSLAHMPFHNTKVIEDWLSLLNDCLSYEVQIIRTCAVHALLPFFSEYFKGDSVDLLAKKEMIVTRYVKEMKSPSQVNRMGYSLALGMLPDFMLKPHLNIILAGLIEAMCIDQHTQKWSESRRDIIKAINSICCTLEDELGKEISSNDIMAIYEVYFTGLSEYTQDKRGDIGAWVREASMSGLQTMTLLLAKKCPHLLTSQVVTKVVAGLAQQAVEKIDRTRALAGKMFSNIIHSDPRVPNIPHHDVLVGIFSQEECDALNWHSANSTFPKFVQLIELEEFTYNLMLGIITSVGGMTETLVKNSSSALFTYLKEQEKKKGLEEIQRVCETISEIFHNYQKVDRITVSILRFLSRIMTSGCLTNILDFQKSDFAKKILKLVQLEIAGCRDVYKLVDGIDVLCQFIQVRSEVCSTALVQLSILLCHRQIYIRRSTATKLYEALLVYGDNSVIPSENLDEIMNILSMTNWEEPLENLREIRNNLCTLMNIKKPVSKSVNKALT